MTETAVTDVEQKNKNKDPTKRPTFAEKLVGVRNSQCEHYLHRVHNKLEHDEFRNMQKIRDDTNRITYDLKTMKVMKKKRELELKKQRNPYLDSEQDEFEIMQAERYLVFDPNICFYTNKKNRYPLRSLAKLDPYHTTPTIAKARKLLQDMDNDRKVRDIQEKRAEMYSRKSMYSVRFQSPDETDGQMVSSENQMLYSSSPHRPEIPVSHSVSKPKQEDNGESLLEYLREKKIKDNKEKETDNFASLDENTYPDDFTECAPERQTLKSTENGVEDIFQLPSVTSEQRSQTFVNSQMVEEGAAFGDINQDLPPHEIALLTQVAQPIIRQTKSASAATRSFNQSTQSSRRQASNSAVSALKRRQYTHAIMRKENKNVEAKVNYFLNSFEDGKRRAVKYKELDSDPIRPESRQTVTFKISDEKSNTLQRSRSASPQKFMGDPSAAINSHYGNSRRASTAVSRRPKSTSHSLKDNTEQNLPGFEPVQRRIPGIPCHSEKRSNRHSATYKLRNLVQELLKNRTKQQMLEYEKMKMGMTESSQQNNEV